MPRKRQPTQANRKLGILVAPDGVCADFDSTNCDSAGQNVAVDSPACSTAEKSTDTFSVFAGFGSTWIYRTHISCAGCWDGWDVLFLYLTFCSSESLQCRTLAISENRLRRPLPHFAKSGPLRGCEPHEVWLKVPISRSVFVTAGCCAMSSLLAWREVPMALGGC